MTGYWNHIPYVNAFNDVENLQSAYNSQESIYKKVHSLVNTARQCLSRDDTGSELTDDIMYIDYTAAWIKATHAIEVRAYMHP